MRTKKLSGGKYIHLCFLNGKSYSGEVHTKEEPSAGRAIMKAHERRKGK